MYIVFLLAVAATLLTLNGRARVAVATSLLTIAVLAGLLVHHMTDKLPISL
jgi:hypothetical protein